MFIGSIIRTVRLFPAKVNVRVTSCGCYQNKFFSAKAPVLKVVKEIDPATGEVKKKKTPVIPKITLLQGDSISITTLEEAENLSKRRDLKLVKIVDVDTKSERPVYKLMTGTEYHAEDLKQRAQRKKERQENFIKGEKVLIISSKISEHDLETHLRKAIKWINKFYEIRVVINAASPGANLERFYSQFETFFKAENCVAKFSPKTSKGHDLKFQIVPVKKETESDMDSGKSDSNKPS